MVTTGQPVGDGLEIRLVLEVIAVNGMLRSTDDRLANEVGRFEVHVSHPHREHVRVAENLFPQVVFNTIGISAIDDSVEVVFHLVLGFVPQICEKFRSLSIR